MLLAIGFGVAIGVLFPAFGAALKPLADGFIKLVRMVIGPIIFVTLACGVARMRELAALGRVLGRALVYFLVVSTLAMALGLLAALMLRPGAGMHVQAARLDPGAISAYAAQAHAQSLTAFLLGDIPTTLLSALTGENLLQVLLVAVLFGTALAQVGEAGRPVFVVLEAVEQVLFRLVRIVLMAAPLGAFAAMAFTVGKFGVAMLAHLSGLLACVYLTSFAFVAVVLGSISWASGFSLWRLVVYLREELLLVLATSSSEAALPSLIGKLERAGCGRAVAGLVVPAGYSLNLDGTNIYLTLSALFIAQACDVHLTAGQLATLLVVSIVSSKGAAGVTGAGFVTLAATLAIVPSIPVAGMALLLGVDRFMSECRSLTNFIGNAVASLVIARWEGELDRDRLERVLGGWRAASQDDPIAPATLTGPLPPAGKLL